MKSKISCHSFRILPAAFLCVATLMSGVPRCGAACVSAPAGLVAWWPGEGNVSDVVQGNNGTLQGGATFAAGKVGQGFRFDGTNGYVQIPDSTALKPANITCEAWVWLDPNLPVNRGGEQVFFKKNTWSAWFEGYSLLKATIDNGGGNYSERFQFCVSRSGNQVAINSQITVQRGVWYHVAATYDGSQSRLYVNGVLEGSATPGFALDYDTTPVFIGTSGTWAPYLSMFGGIIDEPSIYNRALAASEIAALYNAGSAGKCSQSTVLVDGATAAYYNDSLGTILDGTSPQFPIPLDSGGGDPTFLPASEPNLAPAAAILGNWLALPPTLNANWRSVATVPATWGVNTETAIVYALNGGSGGVSDLRGDFDVDNAIYVWVNGVFKFGGRTPGFPSPLGQYEYTNIVLGSLMPGMNYVQILREDNGIGTGYQVHITGTPLTTNIPQSNCTASPSGLVAWWPGNGTTDELVNGNNGALTGGATYTNGIVGQGFSLNGSGNRVIVPDSPALNFGSNQDLSIECWIKAYPNSNPSNVRSIVEKRNAAENYRGYTLFLWDGFLAFQLSEISVGVNYFSFGADLRDGVFHHVAVTVDRDSPTGGRLYVDGQVIYTFNPTGVMGNLSNTDVLRIGSHAAPGDTSYFPGVIDDVAIYNRALAVSEIQSIYNARSAGKCTSASATNPCVTPPSGIVNWWRAEGDAAAAAGGNNGTLFNGATIAAGKVGQAFSFDGVNDYVIIPKAANLDAGNQVTIEFWMKPDAANAMNTYQGLVTSDFYGIEIANGYVLGPLGVSFFLSTDGGASVSSSSYPDTATVNGGGAVVSAGQWHHVAGTYDGTKLQLYIDGQPWGNPNYHTGAISPMLANSFVSIGSEDGRTICPGCVTSRYFNGLIDEPAIYNRALSAGEIQSIYNAGSAGKCVPATATNNCFAPPAGLVNWWQGQGNALDRVSGNTATLANGLGFATAEVGSGFYLDGVNDYLLVNGTPGVAVGSGVTLEGWLNPTSLGSSMLIAEYERVLASFSGSDVGVQFAINVPPGTGTGAGSIVANIKDINDGDHIFSSQPNLVVANVWQHVAWAYDKASGVATFYLNGAAVASTNLGSFTPQTTFANLVIGARTTFNSVANPSDRFSGGLDELGLYNRALSAGEIQSIYNAGSAGKCALASPTNSAPLFVNIDFGAGQGPSAKTGPAAVGQGGSDFWNYYSRDDAFGNWKTFGYLSNLKQADGTTTSAGLTVDNAPGAWGNGSADPMFVDYIYPFSGNATFTVTNLPAGSYDVYAYSTDGNYEVAVGGTSYGIRYAQEPAATNPPVWIEGFSHARFTNVVVSAGQPLVLTVRPGLYGYAILSGMQIVSSGNTNIVVAGQCAPTPSGLVASWRADGNAVDTVSGTAGALENVSFAAGEVGQTFVFNPAGGQTRVVIPDGPAFALTHSLSIEGWIRPTGPSWTVFWRGDNRGGLDPYFIQMNPDEGNILQFIIEQESPNTSAIIGTAPLAFNQWYHIAATLDDATGAMRIYTNGILAAQTITSIRPFANLLAGHEPSLGIGNLGEHQFDHPFVGSIDELSLYSRALSQGEVQAIYNAGSAGKCTATSSGVPVITSFSPAAAAPGEAVTISGNNFHPSPAGNIVYFGAVRATVMTASANSLTVTVPTGATFAPITVAVGGLIAYSSKPFEPTFQGNGVNISSTSFAPGFNLTAQYGAISTVIADLDGDGKPDLADVSGDGHNISLFRNLGAGGTLSASSFAPRVDLTLAVGANGGNPYRLRTADLDRDGKLDLIVSESTGSRVTVYRNNATTGSLNTGSFDAPVSFNVGADSRFSTAADLDADGRPEIVAVNFGDSTISILKNIGMPGSISAGSFAPAVNFPCAAGPYEVVIGDLDGDGKPDLALANASTSVISVFRNTTVAGTIDSNSFAPRVDFPSQSSGHSLALGDLDGDGKLDLVVTFVTPNSISVFRNLSTPGSFTTGSLAAPVNFGLPGWGHTVTLADFNGDGKPDIAEVGELPSYLAIFQNISTPGSFTTASLAPRVDFGTGWNAWGVAAGDIDGDGRPDVLFANQYDGTLTIYQNQVPFGGRPQFSLQPVSQSVTVGNHVTFTALATGSEPLRYQWQFNGTNLDGATNTSLSLVNVQLHQAGNYSVLATNPLDSVTSSNAFLTVNPAVCLPPPAGLISWWAGESNALDRVSGNDGIIVSGIDYAPGEAGQAFSLNGSSAIMRIPASLTLGVGAGQGLTVEAWLNPKNVAGFHPIFEWNSGTLIGVHLWIGSNPADNGVLFANVVDTSGNSHVLVSAGQVIVPNQLQHVALTYDKTTGVGRIYLDGQVVAQADLGVFNPQTSVDAWVSSRPGDHPGDWTYDTHFDGLIDELSLYNRALSQAEIQSVYDAAGAGKCNVPVAPTIVMQPQGVAAPYGTTATFGVVAGGTAPLHYQWLVNNNLLDGETNDTLTVSNLQFSLNGNLYSVTITNTGGSVTSSEALLTVINDPPQISSISAQRAPLNTTIGPVAFVVSDTETPADQLIVTASSSNTSIVPTNQILLGGSSSNRTVTILPGTNAPGSATITLKVTDALGASATRSFSVTWDQFTEITPALPSLQYSAVAWGDYDNDGKLDLLVSGMTNASVTASAITRIYHNDGGVFTNFISLPGLYKCALAWSDYDRDGWLDIAINGLDRTNLPYSRIYHNNGNGTFTDINAGLTGVYNGSVAWGDFNSDGAPDLFLCGLVTTTNPAAGPASTNLSRLYRNDGGGVFTDMNANLPAPSLGTAAWGDYDNDGRPDLLLVGSSNNVSSVGAIYRNLGNGSFSNLNLQAFGYYYGGSAAWGDYDNDGRLDFAVFNGITGGSYVYRNLGNNNFTSVASFASRTTPQVAWGDVDNDGDLDLLVGNGGGNSSLYRNNGNGAFAEVFLSLTSTALAWGDFDNDGDLDAVSLGGKSTLLRNNAVVSNTPPAAPYDLTSTTALTNGVVLRWQAPVDSQTKSNGLNYNLRVGTVPGGIDVVSPLADPISGLRRVAALGNVGPTNRVLFSNLPKGTYYWSVQAIDTAFAGSSFPGAPIAGEASFTITNARPVISDLADITIAPGTNTPGPVMPFVIGDAETFAGSLVVTVRSSNTNVVATNNIVIVRGVPSNNYPSNCTVRVAARTNGVSIITVTVTDAQGAFASDSFTVRAEQFSLLSTNFVPVENSAVAWGDYDNDGDLDVVIAGNTNGFSSLEPSSIMLPVTRLYRNDGGGAFVNVPAGFPGVGYGSLAWNDYDNDGRLDLLITGTTNNQVSGAIARVYRNNGDGTFSNSGVVLPGVYYSAAAWGDYDNDGRADILITGTTNGNNVGTLSRLYRNNRDGTFTNALSFPGIQKGSVAFADFDGDGDLDFVQAGQGSTLVSSVYRNNGTNSFTLMQTSLLAVYNCSLAVGDADNDGRPDILLSGYNNSYVTWFYRNLGNFSFTSFTVESQSQGARYASAALGDFDNDGRLDVLLSGTSTGNASGAFTRVYRNTGSFISQGIPSFSLVPTALPTNYYGAVAWADFDNDGDLDILVTGTDGVGIPNTSFVRAQTQLFRNNSGLANTPPAAPTALTFVRSNNVVALAWAKATDAQTRTILVGAPITNYDGIKYQIRIGTNSGGIQTASPLADSSNGYRRVVLTGDASTNRWQLRNLSPGTYFWSVQAIDTAFAGSPFAAENSFIVSTPPVAVADAVSTPSGTPAVFPAAKLAINDISAEGYPLTVTGVSPTSAQGRPVTLSAGQITYNPQTQSGNDTFTYTVSDGVGGTATGTVTVTVGKGGAVSLNIVYGPVVEGGDFVVRFAGIPGFTYTVEWTPALSQTWFKAGNITAPITDTGFGIGVFEFRQPAVGNRFFRTVYPAY